MKIFAIFLFNVLFLSQSSCSNSIQSSGSSETNCETLVRNLINSKNTKEILNLYQENLNKDESCVFAILDLSLEAYIKEKDFSVLNIIDTLSCFFDGYISDYYIDLYPRLIGNEEKNNLIDIYNICSSKENCCLYENIKNYIDNYDIDNKYKSIIIAEIELNIKNIEYKNFLEKLLIDN